MRAALILGAAFLLAACEREDETYYSARTLELKCEVGFEALSRDIKERRATFASEYEFGSSAYRDDRTDTVYIVTLPDHPAHPAIFARYVLVTSEGASIGSGACGYGDKSAFDEELRRYIVFDHLLTNEESCSLCSGNNSPSITHRGGPIPPPPL